MSVAFQATRITAGDYVDYTPSGADIDAGDVVVQGELVGIAERAIEDGDKGALAVTGIFDVEREASTAFTAGDEVWWDADGTSEDGNTGAAVDTADGGTNKFLGYAVADVADAAANLFVRVAMRNDVSRATMAVGDLSDCGDGAPTSGDLLIGDGDSWEAEPVSGLVTLAADGEVGLPDQADSAIGLPIIVSKAFDGTAAEVSIFDGNCPRKMRIVDVWIEITAAGASATTVKLDNGTNDITDAIDCYDTGSVGDTDIVRAGEIDDAYSTLDVDDTLDITVSDTTDSPAGIVRVLAIPVA